MTEHRPDPDALLAHVQAEEARRIRGKLKIFLGAAAGVGKTYAMLQAAPGPPSREGRHRHRLGGDARTGGDGRPLCPG